MVGIVKRPSMDFGVNQLLDTVKHDFGLSDKELATILQVEPPTFQNWCAGRRVPQRAARERLMKLDALLQDLHVTFRDSEGIARWMHGGSAYLGGFTPIEALQLQRFDRVEAALEVLDSGMFL